MANCIITLMFHRVNDLTDYDPKRFAQYLSYLVQNFPIVVPGDPLPSEPVAVCLTFDDAYYDFYHDVFPLLQKHQIKAILAVPVKYIVETTTLSPIHRLAVPYPQEMNDHYLPKVPFCTWQELRELASSKLVLIASHGFSHIDLTKKEANLSHEIYASKERLEKEIDMPIKYFFYPFGKMTRRVHQVVCQNYDYAFRIGSALNVGWPPTSQLVYRVDAEPLWTQFKPITKGLVNQLWFKNWRNRLRLI